MTKIGVHNTVIAPTAIPKKAGKRVKNDKIDACDLAQYLVNGQLTSVYVPSNEDEVVREMTRQRDALRKHLIAARQQVLGFLRRHGLRYREGKTNWTKTYWRWLSRIHFESADLQLVFLNYVEQVEKLLSAIGTLDQEIKNKKQQWARNEVVNSATTLKGFDVFNTTSLVAEIGSFSRFKSAGAFMGYIGIVPSEYSSGKRTTRGRITKMGNHRVRRLLVEAAQAYRKPPRKSAALKRRWEHQPEEITSHAWKAQRRLYKQYWKHLNHGKQHNLAIIAIARELAGFLWALGCMAEHRIIQNRKHAA